MKHTVNIIPANEAHIEAACEIAIRAWTPIRAAFRERLGDELYEAHFDGWQKSKRAGVEKALRSGHAYVAMLDNRVVGFIGYHLNEELKSGEIGNNAVDPDFRGMGIGSQMYEFVLAKMKDAGMLYATVNTGLDDGHIPARRAYEKAGFEKNLPSVRYYKKL